MKTSIEHVTDMKTATRKWGDELLVVALAADTRFVWSMFSTWPQLLKNLVQQGGVSVGIFTTLKTIDGKVAKPYPAGQKVLNAILKPPTTRGHKCRAGFMNKKLHRSYTDSYSIPA